MTVSDPHWQAILGLREENDLQKLREGYILGAMLTGGEGTLFGKPVRIRLEWPEGLPGGMDEAGLRAMGERLLAAQPAPRDLGQGWTQDPAYIRSDVGTGG